MPATHANPGRAVRRIVVSGPADVELIERTGARALLPADTIYEALKAAAALRPAHPAVIQLDVVDDPEPSVLTFADYLAQSERAAVRTSCLDGSRVASTV